MGLSDLFKAGHRSSNPEVRLKAVESLADQDALTELAQFDSSPRVRLAAVQKITDQELLRKVALDGKEIDARIAAVERIESQDVLAEIIKARKNFQLMGACFSRITDTKVLERIAYDTEYNMSARRMAIENYADESFLEDMAPTSTKTAPKTPQEIDDLIKKYGAVSLARGLGKFRGSTNAMHALGDIMRRGEEAGFVAIESLANGLIHANGAVRTEAHRQLATMTESGQILHLIRLMDKAPLQDAILAVLKEIDHPEARQIVERG
ncbi:MAG: HEAT repeat domain-containing protein [Candidatus Zixiibacteriota bacterium]